MSLARGALGGPPLEALIPEEAPPPPAIVNRQQPVWTAWLRVAAANDNQPVRHRVAFGGRGAAKSWGFAEELLVRGCEQPLRILCAREFQKSIRDSVKRLLDDTIDRLGLGMGPGGNGFYLSTDNEIRGANGTLFIFHGLHRNVNTIKSLEGIDICWVEEAHSVSQSSIDSLIPTIRKEGSEIWWSFNPNSAKDPVDKMFRGASRPPPGTVLINVNYYDNPFFPEVLRRDMEYDQGRDPDKYAHVWLGAYIQRSDSKVFKHWRIRPFEIPEGAVRRFGADWGFATDPTVLVDGFIGRWSGEAWESEPIADPEGRVLFVRHEAYAIGCPIDEIPSLFAGDDRWTRPGAERWKNEKKRPGIEGAHAWRITADSARPELIAYMKARGFSIEPAIKGPGSIEDGISFLQSFDICVHPDCVHVADELTHYSYKVDKLTNEVLPELADKDNNTIDSLRYALEGVRRAGSGKTAFASAGRRATLIPDDKRALEAELRNGITGPAQAPSGGSGWGSAPGFRKGLL